MGIMELTAKKTIKATHRKRMADNEFNVMFDEVEIDDSFCLNNFMEAEIDFEHIYKKLRLHRINFDRKLTFRVRKIKSDCIYGRYYPMHRTLVVDVKHMDSFAHELAHLIDYEAGEQKTVKRKGLDGQVKERKVRQRISEGEDFNNLYNAYVENYDNNKRNNGMRKYHLERQEAFARCFEVYVAVRFEETAIAKSPEIYRRRYNNYIYPIHDSEIVSKIEQYFDKLFTVLTAVA